MVKNKNEDRNIYREKKEKESNKLCKKNKNKFDLINDEDHKHLKHNELTQQQQRLERMNGNNTLKNCTHEDLQEAP